MFVACSEIPMILLQLIFIYVERDNEDVGVPVSNYFGVTGDGPKVICSSLFLFRLFEHILLCLCAAG